MLKQNNRPGGLTLTVADLVCARGILESKKDPALMYDYLASKGDRYAVLANGVARRDSIAGETAINYLKDKGADHNKSLDEVQINAIRFDMALGYIGQLESRLRISSGTIYGDIDHKEATSFHNDTFQLHGLPEEAWTLDPIFKIMPENQREGYWQEVLNAAGKPADEMLLSLNTVKMMMGELSTAPASKQPIIHKWLLTIADTDNIGAVSSTLGNQLLSVFDDKPIPISQCPIDITINPTPQATMRIIDENQGRRDVANGFLVNRPTHSLSFSDRTLDKTDFVSAQIGGLAAGGVRPGEIQLDPNVQPSRYLSEYYLERPDFMLPETGLFDGATINSLSTQTTFNTYVDPLLLDLTGQGVTMTGLQDGVLFDTENNDRLKRTGWAGRGTGMLVIDKGLGLITNTSQMYSEYYAGAPGLDGEPGQKRFEDAFAALAHDDSDGNGVIDHNDAIWGQLRIWQDSSHNGQVDAGELKTLAEWGISQINVASTAVGDEDSHGNQIVAQGQFTIKGKQQEVLAVNFIGSPVSHQGMRFNNGALITSAGDEITTTAYVTFSHDGEILDAEKLDVDNLYGGNGDDTLIANAKGSWLVGRGGSNTYIGKEGDDVFVISASDDTSNIKGNGGRDTVLIVGNKGVGLNMGLSGVTIAQGGGGNDVIVSGSNNSVFIRGGSGNATLVGGGGNDVLAGGSGKNKIVGGRGKAVIYAGPQGDTIYAAEQGSIIYAGGGGGSYLRQSRQ